MLDYSIEDIQQGYADMLRSDYSDQMARYRPIEQHYRDLIFDPAKNHAFNQAAMGYATEGVNGAFNQAQNWQTAMNRKYGTQLDSTEQASVNRRLGNSRSALLAQAQTGMRDQIDQREKGMLVYLNNIYTNDRQASLSQMGHLAGLDAQRTANNDALNNAARTQRNQAVGGAIGTFGSMALAGHPVTGGIMAGIGLLGSIF